LRRIWAARGFWRRYNDDGYGEHDDDSPFDGRGRGRPWPLLTGERGHYEIARGRDPLPYLEAMARMALPGGMLPEQVWDAPPIAQRGLNIGRPTGSARPLAWAHAQYLKLLASRALGCPFDRPEAAWQRYRGERCNATRAIWSEQARISTISVGDSLLVTLCTPASVRWGFDGWQNIEERPTTPNHQGLHVLPIDTAGMIAGQRVDFAFRYSPSERWIGIDYRIDVMSTA
jgi:glucoamylase